MGTTPENNLRAENLKRIGLTEDDIEKEISFSRNKILEHMANISQVFIELGYADRPEDVKITIGPELECTEIGDHKAYLARTNQISKEIREAIKEGRHPSPSINDKTGRHMPKAARVKELDKHFSEPIYRLTANTDKKVLRVKVEPEPSFGTNVFSEEVLQKQKGEKILVPDLVAANQIEFSAPPYSPIGAAEWLNNTMNKVIHGAKSVGLKRIDFKALPNQATAPNSIHLNSVITVKGKNAFSKAEWENNSKARGKASDLLLCVGKEHIDYLKHSLFLFARAKNDYERFEEREVSGPTYLGIPPRKEHGNFCTAMFRGEKRKTERVNSAYPDREDEGPMRFELRVPAPGAAGHPNKDAYPEQRILPYQLIEAYLHMIEHGVMAWKERELNKKKNMPVDKLHEASLNPSTLRLTEPEHVKLPDTKAKSVTNFLTSDTARHYWGERINRMLLLSDRLDQINVADIDPRAKEKGPHVTRLLTSPLPDQTRRI